MNISLEQRKRNDQAVRRFMLSQPQTSETRDLISTASPGQSFIPQEFSNAVLNAAKFYSPVAEIVNNIPVIGGRPTKQPLSDFTGTGMSLVTTEGTTSFNTSSDPVLRSQLSNLDSVAVISRLSIQQLNDSNFDLIGWFREQIGPIVGRATSQALTLGTTNDGTNTTLPATTPLLPAITAVSGVTGSTIATTLSTANIILLMGKVNRGYYPTAKFMTSSSGWLAIAGMNDTTGRPIFPVGNDGVLRVYGFEVVPNESFPASGTANGLQLAFGSFQHFYSFYDGSLSFRVLKELYASTLEVGVQTVRRLSGLPATGALASSVAGLFNANA